MLWIQLAWRNLWRNSARTIVQLAVIAGSLFFSIWMNNIAVGSYDKMIEDAVKMGSGHISFHFPGYITERKTDMIFNLNEAQQLIKGLDQVKKTMPRLLIPALARSSRDNKSSMVMGIDFEKEIDTNPILQPSKLVSGEIPPYSKTNRAFLGAKLAKILSLKVGQKFVLMFQDLNGEIASKLFRVGGTFKSGISQLDSSTIMVDRKSIAKTFGNSEAVHELAILLKSKKHLQKIVDSISAKIKDPKKLGIYSWNETMKQVADAMKMDHAQFKIMVIMLYVLVGVGTVNLMLMSVLERTREFGLLRAIGLDKKQIKKVVKIEAALLGMFGTFIGFTLATISSAYSWHYGLDFTALVGGDQEMAGMLFTPIIHSAWDIPWMIGLSISMMIIVFLASIYPSNKALKANPAEAMRKY